MKKLGANKVIMVDKAFDTEQHFPMKITKEEVKVFGADVGFIGSYAPERKDILEFLARYLNYKPDRKFAICDN